MSKYIDLVATIKANPGCVAVVDNDCWTLYKKHPDKNPYKREGARDDWDEDNTLVCSGQVETLGDGGYGSGNCYGGDILQALAVIVGIEVVSE